jgi:hypothetical protein
MAMVTGLNRGKAFTCFSVPRSQPPSRYLPIHPGVYIRAHRC